MQYTHQKPAKSNRKKIIIALALVVGLIILGCIIWKLKYQKTEPETTPNNSVVEQKTVPTEEKEEPEFDKAEISRALKKWSAQQSGVLGVTITDKHGTKLAEVNGDKTFFAASIYKLYVAYIGYQKIDDGTYSKNESYLNGWTRGKCLDEMIRTSHSPCAEKMWNELGKEALTAKLGTYGLKNTSMTGLYTSSADAAIILARLERGEGLSASSRKSMLDSMFKQIYQDTLQKGFKVADVYSKIGFRETSEYHDTAIVHLKDGRSLVVSVLTDGVGTKNIVNLGANLEAIL